MSAASVAMVQRQLASEVGVSSLTSLSSSLCLKDSQMACTALTRRKSFSLSRRTLRQRLVKVWLMRIEKFEVEPVVVIPKSKRVYIAYKMTVQNSCSHSWQSYHRYNEFREFRKTLLRFLKANDKMLPKGRELYEAIKAIDFPSKHSFGKSQPRIVSERVEKLRSFMLSLLHSFSLLLSVGADDSKMLSQSILTSSHYRYFEAIGEVILSFLGLPVDDASHLIDSVKTLRDVNVSASNDGCEIECSICLNGFEPADQAVETHCGHLFHESCALDWLKKKTSCAYCTVPLDS